MTPTEDNATGGGMERPSVIAPDKDKSWWCPECREWVQNEHVTYEETHDTRNGGCGYGVK